MAYSYYIVMHAMLYCQSLIAVTVDGTTVTTKILK